VPLHVGEEVVNPGVMEDQTDGGGSGGDAENRGDGDDAPVPDPAPSLAALPIYLHQQSTIRLNKYCCQCQLELWGLHALRTIMLGPVWFAAC